MPSRTSSIILSLVFLGLFMTAVPAMAQTVVDLGADTIRTGHSRHHGDIEVSVTTKGDTAIIIRRNPGSDSLRTDEESDVVRTGESIVIGAEQTVGGDVVSIGGSVTVSGHVRGDAVAIGGDVTVKDGGRVDGDAVSIGGRVNRDEGSHIGGQNVGMSFPRENARAHCHPQGDLLADPGHLRLEDALCARHRLGGALTGPLQHGPVRRHGG